MRRGTNPMAVLIMAVIVIATIFFAFLIKENLPEALEKWEGVIFWGALAGGAGLGGIICGRFSN